MVQQKLVNLAESNDQVSRLLCEIATQNQEAFHTLYELTSQKLFNVLFWYLRHHAEAEDALQDVYLKIWLRAHQYDPAGGHGISWLVRISKNHALSCLRMRRYAHDGSAEILNALSDPGPSTEAQLIMAEDARWVTDYLLLLKPDTAVAIQEAYINERSYAYVAARHNVPINTLRTRLRRGRFKIKEAYNAR